MDSRRQELAEFLRALRQRSIPATFGFPEGSRRRTRGLRREEVAQLAGISATWYTWIEQGREVNISVETLDRLAQAMRLSRSERNYLFDLAGQRDPHSGTAEQDAAPPALVAILVHVAIPAYLLGRYWDMLAWNTPASELFAGWLDQSRAVDAPPPNLLRFVFLHALARQLVVNWEARARRLVAEFRADCSSRLEDPALQQLVGELSRESTEFDRYWKLHDVLERQGGRREFHHPRLGLIAYHQVTLRPVEQEALKLVLLNPQS